MAVVENATVDFGMGSQDSGVTNNQDHSNVPILRSRDQTLYGFQMAPPTQQQSFDQNMGAQNLQVGTQSSNGGDFRRNGDVGENLKRDMMELQELFSKLNPMDEEFVPPSLASNGVHGGFCANNTIVHNNGSNGHLNGNMGRRFSSQKNLNQGKGRMNSRTSMAQQVTEEQLAALFINCGQAESAIAALNCSVVVLGSLPIRVSPSKTPVRPRVPWTSMP